MVLTLKLIGLDLGFLNRQCFIYFFFAFYVTLCIFVFIYAYHGLVYLMTDKQEERTTFFEEGNPWLKDSA